MGRHTFLDLYECDQEKLNEINNLEETMLQAAKLANATIIKSHFHKFSPQGISGSVIIAESHFNIHTWPEYGYAAVDLFTCGEGLDEKTAVNFLIDHFESKKHEVKTVMRGSVPALEKS